MPAEQDHATHFYGIDPGSGKPWAVYKACRPTQAAAIGGCNYATVPIHQLDGLIGEIAASAMAPSAVLLSIDAPVNRVDRFDAPGLGTAGRHPPTG